MNGLRYAELDQFQGRRKKIIRFEAAVAGESSMGSIVAYAGCPRIVAHGARERLFSGRWPPWCRATSGGSVGFERGQ